ncbi:MAG: helix-turn-helix domain-containing protein [Akkermansiaceae bacterium]
MESHEVLRAALQKTTPKAVAAELGVSLSLVYKWAEKPTELGSGSKNPLDRLLQIIELSGDTGIVEWLCRQQGGHFVRNPDSSRHKIDHVIPATQQIIGHFSELLTEISTAAVDRSVCKEEAKDIRQVWDKLKSYAEGFVRCCENGDFREMEAMPPVPSAANAGVVAKSH